MNTETYTQRVNAIRQKWGKKLLILGHYYVPDEVIRVTDKQGDSLALSRMAEADEEAEAVVFCGVHFMAETADILENSPEKMRRRGGSRVPVMLVDAAAGCPMADMAKAEEVEAAWEKMTAGNVAERSDAKRPDSSGESLGTSLPPGCRQPPIPGCQMVPVTYVNSSAAVKAFCGRHGGVVCTSANARAVLEWAFSRGERVLFLPDQNLGRNTALAMGIPAEEILLWPATAEEVRKAKVILWNGYCPIHHEMTLPAETQKTLIVHPECRQEIVAASEVSGSTTELIRVIHAAQPGERFIVGTEATLVNRLRAERPEVGISHLGAEHFCEDMLRNTLKNLCEVLESLDAGVPKNVVEVPEEIAADARMALERMLAAK